ncbi:MAG: hypothetical protein MUC98_07170 [Desulfobacterota bacterium]|nr:hypothetical protein [Thermodesulfobacteriota bacterium]
MSAQPLRLILSKPPFAHVNPARLVVVYCTIQRYSGALSLIRETLRKSPDERLEWHQGLVAVIEELRDAIKVSTKTPAEKTNH